MKTIPITKTNVFALAAFFLLALLPVWIIVPLRITSPIGLMAATLASALSPSIAALLTAAFVDGRGGLTQLKDLAFDWRVKLPWLFIAIACPIACALVPILLLEFIAPAAYTSTPMTPFSRAALIGVPVFAFFEELGWMGFAMPRLQRNLSPLYAALIVGFVQGLYHLPVFVFHEVPYSLMAALIMTISFRISLAWIWNYSGGSVLIAALYHTFVNLSQLPTIAGVAPPYVDVVLAGGFLVGAILVVVFARGSLGKHQTKYSLSKSS